MKMFHKNLRSPTLRLIFRAVPINWAALILPLSALLLGFNSVQAQKVLSAEQIAGIRTQAEKGDAQAQWMLGHFYYYGDSGLATDLKTAENWYRKAADQGYPRGQFYLAKMYEQGEAVSQDFGKAAQWYAKAADLGDADGQYALAQLYLKGKGVATNQQEALKWFKRAAFQNHSAAQGWCGYFYVNGISVPQDYVEAYAWHNLSTANDPSNAGLREFRSKVMHLMTKEQIADGQKRSTELLKEIEVAQNEKKSATNQSQGNLNNDANKKIK